MLKRREDRIKRNRVEREKGRRPMRIAISCNIKVVNKLRDRETKDEGNSRCNADELIMEKFFGRFTFP